MSHPGTPNADPRKCKLCHARERYFQAELNTWLPYCDRDCAHRATELYTADPAMLCVVCYSTPRYVNYETNTVDPFCSDYCARTAESGSGGWIDATPGSTHSQPSSRLSSATAVNQPLEAIYFYETDQTYYFLTNFAPYPVEWKGRIYPTSEHLFQAFKFIHQYPDIAEEIRRCARPRDALAKARQYEDYIRPDWRSEGVNIQTMRFVIKLKFRQHTNLWRKLLDTSGATLIEDAGARDGFWGNGADGRGKNWLGVLLMELRDQYAAKL